MKKFPTEYWPGTNSQVEFIPTKIHPNLPVTAVKIYIFQDDNLLLTNIKSRGWDLPGGHVEQNERAEDAVARELKEETGANIKQLALIGYLKVTNKSLND